METDGGYEAILDKVVYLENLKTYQIRILVERVHDSAEQTSSHDSITSVNSSEETPESNSPETIDENKPEMPTYNGGSSWNLFIEKFEAFAELNELPQFDWPKWLLLALNGPALEALDELNSHDRKQYWKIVQVLERKFCNAENETKLSRIMLKLRRQKLDETLVEYGEAVQRLANVAYYKAPQELLEHLTIQAFIDGLKNAETRKALILADHVLMRSALMDAVKFESRSSRIADAEEESEEISPAPTYV